MAIIMASGLELQHGEGPTPGIRTATVNFTTFFDEEEIMVGAYYRAKVKLVAAPNGLPVPEKSLLFKTTYIKATQRLVDCVVSAKFTTEQLNENDDGFYRSWRQLVKSKTDSWMAQIELTYVGNFGPAYGKTMVVTGNWGGFGKD